MSNSSRVMSYLMSWLIGALTFVLGVRLLTGFIAPRMATGDSALWGTIAAAGTVVVMVLAAALAVLAVNRSLIDQGWLTWLALGMPGVLAFSLFNSIRSMFYSGISGSGSSVSVGLSAIGFAVLATFVGSIAGGYIRRAFATSARGR